MRFVAKPQSPRRQVGEILPLAALPLFSDSYLGITWKPAGNRTMEQTGAGIGEMK